MRETIVERTINYNPSDYKAIQNEAKEMSKPDLEEYYVLDKDKKHTTCAEGFAIGLTILFVIFVIGGLAYVIAQDHFENNIEDSLTMTTNEICPILGEGYQSEKFYKEYGSEIARISCDEYNSNPLE